MLPDAGAYCGHREPSNERILGGSTGAVRRGGRLNVADGTANDKTVLVVRHGPGRGRLERYCQHVVDHLSVHEGLQGRLRVHETGRGGSPSLDGVRAVVFWLADPLRSYPECLREAQEIAARARARDVPIVNPPEILEQLDRRFVFRRWEHDGVPSPLAISYASREEFTAAASRIAPPLLVREIASHSRRDASLLLDPAAVERGMREDLPVPGIAIRYVDVRREYRRRRPLSIWAKFHHRKRAWVVGSHVFRDTLFFSKRALVGSEVSTFARQRERREEVRRRLPAGHARGLLMRGVKANPDFRRSLRVERRWAAGAPENRDLLLRAARSLGLGWVAFDFSTRADGSLLFWEANPYPYFPDARQSMLRRERDVERRMARKYEVLERFFQSLLGGSSGGSRGGGI